MNWKNCPWMFANGKFNFKVEETVAEVISYINTGAYYLYSGEDNEADEVEVTDCQLIARSIEDMTDGEWKNIKYGGYFAFSKYDLIDYIRVRESWEIPFGIVQGLLDIGIYPFSDTEDVIFKPKQS